MIYIYKEHKKFINLLHPIWCNQCPLRRVRTWWEPCHTTLVHRLLGRGAPLTPIIPLTPLSPVVIAIIILSIIIIRASTLLPRIIPTRLRRLPRCLRCLRLHRRCPLLWCLRLHQRCPLLRCLRLHRRGRPLPPCLRPPPGGPRRPGLP